jgi:hypothetical protein
LVGEFMDRRGLIGREVGGGRSGGGIGKFTIAGRVVDERGNGVADVTEPKNGRHVATWTPDAPPQTVGIINPRPKNEHRAMNDLQTVAIGPIATARQSTKPNLNGGTIISFRK